MVPAAGVGTGRFLSARGRGEGEPRGEEWGVFWMLVGGGRLMGRIQRNGVGKFQGYCCSAGDDGQGPNGCMVMCSSFQGVGGGGGIEDSGGGGWGLMGWVTFARVRSEGECWVSGGNEVQYPGVPLLPQT